MRPKLTNRVIDKALALGNFADIALNCHGLAAPFCTVATTSSAPALLARKQSTTSAPSDARRSTNGPAQFPDRRR